jgi:hypothetical protein
MTSGSPRNSAEIFAFVPRKIAAPMRASSTGTRAGGNAVVDLAARIARPMELPRMDFCDGWYHAEAILDDGRNRKA